MCCFRSCITRLLVLKRRAKPAEPVKQEVPATTKRKPAEQTSPEAAKPAELQHPQNKTLQLRTVPAKCKFGYLTFIKSPFHEGLFFWHPALTMLTNLH